MNKLALVQPRREVMIGRWKVQRAKIQQLFDDAAHWNATHPNEPPIDPDEDGALRRLADAIDKMLAKEAA